VHVGWPRDLVLRPDIELLLQRFDIESYVRTFGPEREGRSEYLVPCPKCGLVKLTVNVRSGRWRCFRCEKYKIDALGKKTADEGAGGSLGLVKWMEGLNTPEALQRIAEFVSHALGSPDVLPEPAFQNRTERAPAQPTGLPQETVAIAGNMPYLARRGITPEDVRQFGLGWCSSGWLANRLVFPVWEQDKCIYWQARAMWDEHEHVSRPFVRRDGSVDKDKFRKTLNPAAERNGIRFYGSGDVLLNLEQAARYPRVCITEGPTSCIRTGPDAVATFGKQLSSQQIARLVRANVRAVDFMWDGPSAKEPAGAWEAMIAASAQLAAFMEVRIVFLPQGDPGDYTREELKAYRAHARPYSSGHLLL